MLWKRRGKRRRLRSFVGANVSNFPRVGWYIVSNVGNIISHDVIHCFAADGPVKCCEVACSACNPIIVSFARSVVCVCNKYVRVSFLRQIQIRSLIFVAQWCTIHLCGVLVNKLAVFRQGLLSFTVNTSCFTAVVKHTANKHMMFLLESINCNIV